MSRYVWLLVVAALAVVDTACASFDYQELTCHWLELEDAQGLEVTARRVKESPYDVCPDAPGYYRLGRDAYTVEFWNGERADHPELFLRALDIDGSRLAVQSLQFFGKPNAQLRGKAAAGKDYDFYDYFLVEGMRVYKPGERIEFAVLDATGREIGRELLRVVSKIGGKWRSYY